MPQSRSYVHTNIEGKLTLPYFIMQANLAIIFFLTVAASLSLESGTFPEGELNPAEVCATLSLPVGVMTAVRIPVTFIPGRASKLL